MIKRAIVLGAAGFVGRHVARTLAGRGVSVAGIGHGAWSRNEWRDWGVSDWRAADVTLEALLTYAGEPDLIVQCAGSGSVGFSMTHPVQDFARSVEPTLAALEFIRTSAPHCALVLPSSAAVYGSTTRQPITVAAPQRPESPYGVHKVIAEELCRSYAKTFGVSAAVVRLFSVYGAGLRKQLLWDACGKLMQGSATFSGTGHEQRDWLAIEDAAALLVTAGDHASPDCPVANGGTGRATEIAAIVARLDAALGAGGDYRFAGKRRDGDPDIYQADAAEALAWGWRPACVLDEQLAAYADWYRREAA